MLVCATAIVGHTSTSLVLLFAVFHVSIRLGSVQLYFRDDDNDRYFHRSEKVKGGGAGERHLEVREGDPTAIVLLYCTDSSSCVFRRNVERQRWS